MTRRTRRFASAALISLSTLAVSASCSAQSGGMLEALGMRGPEAGQRPPDPSGPAGSASGPPAIEWKSIPMSRLIGAGQSAVIDVPCPVGYVVTSAGLSTTGLTLLSSAPLDRGTWRVVVQNRISSPASAVVSAVCVKLR
jgi:hypothetical protein